MKIGAIEIAAALDGTGRLPRTEIVGRDVEVEWDCPGQPMDQNGKLRMDFGAHLIRTADRTILVDAGLGSISDDRHTGGGLPESLRRLGVEFEDVTDVLFTHLHYDHVGWATQKGKIMFPRATYRVHADDWTHFVTSSEAVPGAVRKLSPLEPQLETFDSETELAPGVIARPAPGHTPGSTVFLIADGKERALLLGDVAHSVAELTDPEWQGLSDVDPVAARIVRDRLLNEAAAAGDLIGAAHFADLKLGRLIVAADGRRSFTFI